MILGYQKAVRLKILDRIVEVSQELQHLPLYIDQTGGISIGQLAARARRLKRQRGLDLLIVDYIQLIQSSTRRASDSRVQEVTEITTSLKALAKELNLPILALSQLSRQVESREDKRPQLSDLRESGSIEQDADVVLFVFREEYYLKNRKPKEGTEEFFKWQAEMEQVAGRAEVIIGKQRNGPVGTVKVVFLPQYARFENIADAGVRISAGMLIDRAGSVVGKYRKVYLPREEIEGGLTPGNEYPVFRTDFGTVGILICWDSQYADPARALALNGSELLLMPIWGGNETLVKARAIENRVFIATSGYNYPTHIVDPDGNLLATASEQGSVAYATIDLAKRYTDEWLGDMRGRFMKELRLDVKVAHPTGR